MATPILMPALSPTMTEGKIARWLKKEGEQVQAGDIIAEIETDKAVMELEATDEGTLARIIAPEGATEPVNAVIAVLAEEGEDIADIDISTLAPAAAQPAAPAEKEKTAEAGPAAEKAAQAQPAAASAPASTPSAAPANPAPGKRIFATPLARRLAKERGIDLSQIAGSGPHGRIIRRDVENFTPPAATAAPALAGGMSDAQIRALYPQGSYDVEPIDTMRRVIARRLTQSKQTVPHFYLSVDCAIDRLLQVRKAMNAQAPEGEDGKPQWRLSVNDFVLKAWALALKKVPQANMTWTEGGLLKHHHVDISVAVAIEGGLITPIVRAADTKSIKEISAEMKDLAARARARRLQPHEYEGGTTSVSNLGMFGVKNFAAVINPPQATILAVGAGEQRVVAENGQPVVRTVMTVTVSTDHRAVDGAVAAQALAAFKAYIEEPALMFAE